VALVGLIATLMAGGALLLLPLPLPPQPAINVKARKPADRRANGRKLDMNWPYLY
jgi:hypothetical protein